ncbi:hypothetical protein SNE40_019995 [Patella caerulea]|uniref:Endonuclease/exonuclease/phosphatase domain-containing protein n=1 Tax=Patella caerulea TaxID=87958 RepID=A0AAN8GDN9_PATCE
MVVLFLDKNFFNLDSDVVLICVYISPENSAYYNGREQDTMSVLQDVLIEIRTEYGFVDIILAGDFNSRTGDLEDYVENDSLRYIQDIEIYEPDIFNIRRYNLDKEINNYGRQLIDLLMAYGIHLLNGRFPGDREGNYTCFANRGKSAVDYIAISTPLFQYIADFSVLNFDESDHFPIKCKINLKTSNKAQNIECDIDNYTCL